MLAALALPFLNIQYRRRIVRHWSRAVLSILKVKLIPSGNLPDLKVHNVLFVGNHVSWIDIWAINAVCPVRFVSKAEVRAWPIIGWLAEKAGTLFLERARRRATSHVSDAVAEALRAGDCLCVFPEGTTTDGTHIQPFKSSLLQAAVETEAMVWPLAVHYPTPNGPDIGVSFAGDTTLVASLWAILGRREIVAYLDFAQPMTAQGRTRRELASTAQDIISSLVRLPVRAAPGTASDLPTAAR